MAPSEGEAARDLADAPTAAGGDRGGRPGVAGGSRRLEGRFVLYATADHRLTGVEQDRTAVDRS
ncbi:hypothetical protein, partial [Umezawaea sp.]|uniref:hypothetical protein n=1 Tax=Umezawaea sp. TaxID=1955258 RepID=UPI002ED6A727